MLFPYKQFTINTSYSTTEVICELSQVIQSRQSIQTNAEVRKHFVGNINKESFKIVRNIFYLNSFIPTIKGVVEATNRGANIKIAMTGNPCVLLAITAAFSFLPFFLMIMFAEANVTTLYLLIGVLGGGSVGYFFYIVLLGLNMNIDKKYLQQILPVKTS